MKQMFALALVLCSNLRINIALHFKLVEKNNSLIILTTANQKINTGKHWCMLKNYCVCMSEYSAHFLNFSDSSLTDMAIVYANNSNVINTHFQRDSLF